MNIRWNVATPAGLFDEFGGFHLRRQREIHHHVEIAVVLHTVFRRGSEHVEPSAMHGCEFPRLGHDREGGGAAARRLAVLSL